jgi:hypothetical protein
MPRVKAVRAPITRLAKQQVFDDVSVVRTGTEFLRSAVRY